MTRDFNKQERDDRHPSSHNPSSGNYREEEAFKPARPRLSRDAVDRAWENGAPRRHADYNPRQNTTQQNRYQGRPSSSFPGSQQSQQRGPYQGRQDQFRSPSSSNQGYQPRREDAPRPPFRRYSEPGQRTPDRPPYQQNGPADTYRGGSRNFERGPERGPRPPYQQNGPSDTYRGGPRNFERQERGPERGPRPPYQQNGPGASGRNEYRPNGPRGFQRQDRDSSRGNPADRGGPKRDQYNPRWQSRPAAQPEHQAPLPLHEPSLRPEGEQFEGDYERFDARPKAQKSEQPPFEKTVTRLPDGRVLKGSRPAQRKQANFWGGVTSDAEALLDGQAIDEEATASPQTVSEKAMPGTVEAKPPRPGRRTTVKSAKSVRTVKTARAGEAGPKVRKAKAVKKRTTPGTGPAMRPSQRGFKWPGASE